MYCTCSNEIYIFNQLTLSLVNLFNPYKRTFGIDIAMVIIAYAGIHSYHILIDFFFQPTIYKLPLQKFVYEKSEPKNYIIFSLTEQIVSVICMVATLLFTL